MFNREEVKNILNREGMFPFPSLDTKLFFSLSYYTGLSIETVRELRWGNLDLDKEKIRTVKVDGGDLEEVEIFFDHALTSLLIELKENSHTIADTEYLFTDPNGGPVSIETIQKNFELTMETEGIDFCKRKLTPNSFRRTYNFWYA